MTGRSKQNNTKMCLQYREGDFSWKPCDSASYNKRSILGHKRSTNPTDRYATNRQNIGLDTEYNSNWDSPELFPSVYAIASDDEGITPLTVAAGTAVMVMLVKIMQLTITLALPKSSCLLCLWGWVRALLSHCVLGKTDIYCWWWW